MKEKELIAELWEYLDGYCFFDECEVNGAVQEFFMEEYGDFDASYGELLYYGELAEKYIKERDLFV